MEIGYCSFRDDDGIMKINAFLILVTYFLKYASGSSKFSCKKSLQSFLDYATF